MAETTWPTTFPAGAIGGAALRFYSELPAAAAAAAAATRHVLLGPRGALEGVAPWWSGASDAALRRAVAAAAPTARKAAYAEYFDEAAGVTVGVGSVAPAGGRHNARARPDQLADVARRMGGGQTTLVHVLCGDGGAAAFAYACAVARALPRFSLKSGVTSRAERVLADQVAADAAAGGGGAASDGVATLHVVLVGASAEQVAAAAEAAESVRMACALGDAPTNYCHTDRMVAEAMAVAEATGAGIKVIRGDELRDQGFGGLFGVGQAARHPPALVVLTYTPKDADDALKPIALAGKGIVYDTGGLSIKGKTTMPGMKRDMCGSAAVLGAFRAIAALGTVRRTVHALLCLAENSVGIDAQRPDDIVTMYSGKTVEVNNTDAEGRLVLGDGVAYAARHLCPGVIVDMATLTGAQGIATGQHHGALLTPSADAEARVVRAGLATGDLVHPLVYAPEFLLHQFRSECADMLNSVRARNDAQSSCAGHFIEAHLPDTYEGDWIHIDMAAPAYTGDRCTGYGVGLLMAIVGQPGVPQ